AFSHLGADGSRGGSDRGVDAARRGGNEAGCVWMSAGGAHPLSARTRSLVFGSLCAPCFQLIAESYVDREYSMGIALVWVWILARCLRGAGGDRHCLWRDGGVGSKGF